MSWKPAAVLEAVRGVVSSIRELVVTFVSPQDANVFFDGFQCGSLSRAVFFELKTALPILDLNLKAALFAIQHLRIARI